MSQPRVIWCPTAKPQHNGPRFDLNQFHDGPRSLGDVTTELAYSDLKHLHIHRVADLTKGRRLPVQTWALSREGLQSVILRCLEHRFCVRNQHGTSQERLERCREP